jgi:hypothetical protein
MRIDAYIRAVGAEGTIRKVHAETAIPEATIERLKASSANGEFLWNWQIPAVAIDLGDTDGELRALLLAHLPVAPIIKKYSVEADVYLEIVARYAVNDEPFGLFLSPETIRLLTEFGAALDHDVVMDLSDNDSNL